MLLNYHHERIRLFDDWRHWLERSIPNHRSVQQLAIYGVFDGYYGKGFIAVLIHDFWSDIPRTNLQSLQEFPNIDVCPSANVTILLKLRCDLWLICKWLLFPIATITLDICQFKPFHTKLEIHTCPKLGDHTRFQITLKLTKC